MRAAIGEPVVRIWDSYSVSTAYAPEIEQYTMFNGGPEQVTEAAFPNTGWHFEVASGIFARRDRRGDHAAGRIAGSTTLLKRD
jgi:hypothetical protein